MHQGHILIWFVIKCENCL